MREGIGEERTEEKIQGREDIGEWWKGKVIIWA